MFQIYQVAQNICDIVWLCQAKVALRFEYITNWVIRLYIAVVAGFTTTENLVLYKSYLNQNASSLNFTFPKM